ncbi:MAG: dynamin family protein [Sulfuritalea sp.]|nr:dynamin family protein [Sulfuritalea sp.]MDP1983865.1 dynamin family protein [Sulfuritalea sp.]
MEDFDSRLELTELRASLAEASDLEGMDREACAQLGKKLDEHAFNLVVAGEFKRGKSTVINALLGANLLPTGVVPLTSAVTLLRYGDRPVVMLTFENGQERAVDLDALPEYVTERGNPKNVKGVREVAVSYPAEWLKGGIRLVDTPGIGSVHQHNTNVAYQYLPQADAVIFVASVDQPMSRAELDFLIHIRRYAGKVFCLLNKIDYLSESELAESVAFATGALHDALGVPVPVFPVSARLALEGRTAQSPECLARSRFPAFDAALRQFLLTEGGEVWVKSARRNLLRLLSEIRLASELELRALAAPLAQLETNLHAFAVKKQETLQAKSDFDALLEAEGKKLVREKVEPDLEAFKATLVPRLHALLADCYDELRAQGSAALQQGLEERLIAEVRAAFDAWRAEEDAAVGDAFERLCDRFWQSIQNTVDELMRYSAELFAIPFASVGAEHLWQKRSGFYYKFWQEPPALLMLTDGFVRMLPGALGHPIILRHARRRAADLTDMQSGRLRHDFAERIKKSVHDFRREMLERIEATGASIENAIGKGQALRQQGESAAVARRDALDVVLVRIATLETRLKT